MTRDELIEAMLEAGGRSCGDERGNPDETSAEACWSAMLAASKVKP